MPFSSPTNGHVGCLRVRSNNVARRVGTQVSLRDVISSSSGWTPRRGIAQSHGDSIFNFLKKHCVVFHSGSTCYSPTNTAQGSGLSMPSPTLAFSLISRGCVVVSHCSIGFHFPSDYGYRPPFHVLIRVIFFGEASMQALYPLWKRVIICFSVVEI